MTPRARGPRGAGADTRADIIRAALALFTERGYERTSMRAIAQAAGVDPSLPRHYFPSKPALFVEALGPFEGVGDRLATILDAPRSEIGRRVLTAILGFWDSAEYGPRLRTLITSAISSPEIGEVARGFLFEHLIKRVVSSVSPDDVDARAAAVASQVFGLIATRYLFEIEPMASAPAQEIVDRFAPIMQRLIVGDTP